MSLNRMILQFFRAGLCWGVVVVFWLVSASDTWARPLRVTKKIACVPPGADCGSVPNASYRGIKTGFKTDTQLPGFCYKITITNGSATATVTDIQVTDDQLDLSTCGFPTTLGPHNSFTCFIRAEHAFSVTNTVTAMGKRGSTTVASSATVTAIVLPASIMCVKRVTSPDDT